VRKIESNLIVRSYNLRPSGRLDVYSGPLRGQTFGSIEEATLTLDRVEEITNKLGSASRTISTPVVIFSLFETSQGLKNKDRLRTIKGLTGLGLGFGLRKSANALERVADAAGLERELIEELK
jgi:hypothetical protein